eukprot:1802773-Ditylum_brightwellii.AAC.1
MDRTLRLQQANHTWTYSWQQKHMISFTRLGSTTMHVRNGITKLQQEGHMQICKTISPKRTGSCINCNPLHEAQATASIMLKKLNRMMNSSIAPQRRYQI